MFNLFKKKQEPQLSATLLSDLTHKQRMSVMNLLCLVAFGDEEGTKQEYAILRKYFDQLGVEQDDSIAYIQEQGYETMIGDLNQLSREQKHWLVLVTNHIMASDGEVNQEEVAAVAGYFGDLGIEMDEYVSIVEASLRG